MSVVHDVVVIGGGIVGLCTARALLRGGLRDVVVLEAEDRPGVHQSGRNSGVIHSGLYYAPGSLKARNCVRGREQLYAFCRAHNIPHARCGKIVVATRASELPGLEALHRRGQANGLTGLEWLDPDGIRAREPHVRGLAALLVPETGVVDFGRVTRALAQEVHTLGGQVWTSAGLQRTRRKPAGEFELRTRIGRLNGRMLVNCAGLQADRIARMCGLEPPVQIIPFRGQYYELAPQRRHLIRHLVYPVPDPRFPFLGVHFTRTIEGSVHVGPNAVPACHRHGYEPGSVRIADVVAMGCYSGFWRMARNHWRAGLMEYYRTWNKAGLLSALRRLLPAICAEDLRPGRSGVRAQAVSADGRLLDDFCILEAHGMVHVLNAPSPAATAALAIGRHLAERVFAQHPA